MVARRVAFWILAIALQAAPAFGQGQDIRPIKVQAQEDCLAGKTESGVALLAKLYALTGNANFIYNQGRCYEQVTRLDEAISRFREYLRVAKNATPEEKSDAEKHIQECRALKAEQEREKRVAAAETAALNATVAPKPPLASDSPALPTSAPAAAEEQPPTTAIDLSAQPKAESTPIYAKWWLWTGIAVVIGGAVTAYVLATQGSTRTACSREAIPCAAIK